MRSFGAFFAPFFFFCWVPFLAPFFVVVLLKVFPLLSVPLDSSGAAKKKKKEKNVDARGEITSIQVFFCFHPVLYAHAYAGVQK